MLYSECLLTGVGRVFMGEETPVPAFPASAPLTVVTGRADGLGRAAASAAAGPALADRQGCAAGQRLIRMLKMLTHGRIAANATTLSAAGRAAQGERI